MYTVSYLKDDEAPVEIHAAGLKDLFSILCLLNSHPRVKQFKVMEPGYTVTDLYIQFGWGTFEKFVTQFKYSS